MLKDNSIDPKTSFTLDKVGSTPDNHFNGHLKNKKLLALHKTVDMKFFDVAYQHRIILMPIVSKSDEYVPSIFLF